MRLKSDGVFCEMAWKNPALVAHALTVGMKQAFENERCLLFGKVA